MVYSISLQSTVTDQTVTPQESRSVNELVNVLMLQINKKMLVLPYEITKCIDTFQVRRFEEVKEHGKVMLVLLSWLLFCWKCVLDRKVPEALAMLK